MPGTSQSMLGISLVSLVQDLQPGRIAVFPARSGQTDSQLQNNGAESDRERNFQGASGLHGRRTVRPKEYGSFLMVIKILKSICDDNMNTNLSFLKTLRIYQRFSVPQLLGFICCNRVASWRYLMANADNYYWLASFMPGRWVSNRLIGATLSKMLMGGESLSALSKTTQHFT
jgi:hypothetical protein